MIGRSDDELSITANHCVDHQSAGSTGGPCIYLSLTAACSRLHPLIRQFDSQTQTRLSLSRPHAKNVY